MISLFSMIACWFRTFVNLLDLIWTSVVCWVLSEGVGATIRSARLYIDTHAYWTEEHASVLLNISFFEILTVMWACAFSWWGVRLFSMRRTPVSHRGARLCVSEDHKFIPLSFCLIYFFSITVVFIACSNYIYCCCFECSSACLIV